MSKIIISPGDLSDSIAAKPHYHLLDGLRGVAALIVIIYHVFEGFATNASDQHLNHGYLAVDFFFILSGFVIGYAYDDRWKVMTLRVFFRRRLIRLHPMVVIGAVLGAVTFLIQGSVKWDGSSVPMSAVLCAFLAGACLIPVMPGSIAEVRGNGELFPLNGPTWSLFFEYIGNILYAIFLRRFSTMALAVFVFLAGILMGIVSFTDLCGSGNMGVGWTMANHNLIGGFLRMSFSFSLGLLLARIYRPGMKVKGAFWWCSLALVALLPVPYLGTLDSHVMNSVYELVCIMVIFPAIVCVAAGGDTAGQRSKRICRFLGDISYPVYAIHYPVMYLFYAWLWDNALSFSDAWPVALTVVAGNIVLAYLCIRYYDAPVRRWLADRRSHRKISVVD